MSPRTASRAGGCWDSQGVGLLCPVPGLQPCGCWGRLKMPKPGANTTARTGSTSSWTWVLVPGQHPSKPTLDALCWCGSRGSTGAA